jgi:hypothetical protein
MIFVTDAVVVLPVHHLFYRLLLENAKPLWYNLDIDSKFFLGLG